MINLHVYKYSKQQVYIEGHFQAHNGTDLVVMGEAKPICFKVTKSSTLQEFKVSLAKQMVSIAHQYFCHWSFSNRVFRNLSKLLSIIIYNKYVVYTL